MCGVEEGGGGGGVQRLCGVGAGERELTASLID